MFFKQLNHKLSVIIAAIMLSVHYMYFEYLAEQKSQNMNQPRYELIATTNRLQFEFISEGPKGQLIKRIEYTYMESLDFWNLGFGDYNPDTDGIDDQVVWDNGDGRAIVEKWK